MTPKRNRSLHVSAGLMTALSLGVASLAGCASFDPVGPGQPTAVTQVPPTTGLPAATGTGTTTTTTPTTAPTTAAKAYTSMTGTVEVGGKPLANAQIQVLNAFTNKAVSGLVAAGAGNLVAAGAGNLVAAGAGNYGVSQVTTLTTDANGNYAFDMPELANSDMVRIVAKTSDGTSLTALAGGSASASAYSVTQTATSPAKKKKSFKVKIDISSTLATNAMKGLLDLLGSMSAKDRETAIDGFVDGVAEHEKHFDELVASAPAGTEGRIIDALQDLSRDNAGGGIDITADALLGFKQIEAALVAAGIEAGTGDDFNALVADVMKDILDAAASGDGLNSDGLLEISTEDFPPELDINLDNIKEGEITYTDPVTDEVVEVVVDVIEEEPDTNIDDTFTDSAKLAPTVDIVYDKGDANSKLKMTVTQTSSEFDVKTITAKIPKSFVKTINLDDATTLNDAAETDISGGWAGFATASNHTITAVSNSATTFDGDWKDGNSVKIADVTVEDDGGYVTITLTFDIAGNDYIHTQGGSAKLEALDSVITLDTDAIAALKSGSDNIVEISIETRDGNDLPTTTTDTGAAVIYGRPITVIDAL